jgi:hypothetical protein
MATEWTADSSISFCSYEVGNDCVVLKMACTYCCGRDECGCRGSRRSAMW